MIYHHHYQEWCNSGISDDLINLNLQSLPVDPYGARDKAIALLYNLDQVKRDNTGRINGAFLHRHNFLNDGGWQFCGLDLATNEASNFLCLKPDTPRQNQDGKTIKYEHPRNQPTAIFVPRISFRIAVKVALKSKDYGFQKALSERINAIISSQRRDNARSDERLGKNGIQLIGERNCSKRKQLERHRTSRGFGESCPPGQNSRSNIRITNLQYELKRIDLERELGELDARFSRVGNGTCSCSGMDQQSEMGDLLWLALQEDQEFWQAVSQYPLPVTITEGVKKACSLLTQGKCAIALPGIWNWIDQDAPKVIDGQGREKRVKELTRHLKPLTQVKREFVIAFDEDTKITTRHQVKIAQTVLGKVLSKEGGNPSILSWSPEAGKGIDDAIVANGSDWFDRVWKSRRSLTAWLYFDQKLRNVDKQLNQRWLTAEDIESNAKLVGIKSAKGTYKTGAIAEATAEARRSGTRILALSSLVRLTENLGERLGIDTQYNVRTSETKGALGLAITADSLHAGSQARFKPEDWEGCIFVIDEVDQVLKHILTSIGTDIKNHREEVLTNLTLLCQVASKIYIADADLSHTSLSYINSLTGGCSQAVIVNECKPAQGRTAYNYDRPEDLVAEAINAIGHGENIHIVTDSQQPKSLLGTINLEAIIKSIYPDVTVLRGDKETVGNPEHPAHNFTEHLEILPHYQVLITSPIVNTGISIDIENHFDGVYALQVGAQSENASRQSMERVRANVNRHVYFKKIGNSRNLEGGGTDIHAVYGSQKRQTKMHRNFLSQLESEHQLDFECHATHTKAFAEYVARHNLGLSSFREIALEAMQRDGYAIAPGNNLSDEEREMWNDALKASKEANYETRIREILNAPSFEDKQFQELKNKRELTDSQQRTLRKGNLERTYGVTPDEELIEQDDNGIYSKLRLQFWLTQARDRAEERDTTEAKKHAEKTNYKPFQPDFNRNKYKAKVELFANAFNIFEILHQMKGEITNERLQPWWEALQAKLTPHNLKTIKALTGLTISPNETPIRTLGKLLDRIGYKLECLGQRGKQGERYRTYSIQQQNSRTGEIFAYWLSQLKRGENTTIVA